MSLEGTPALIAALTKIHDAEQDLFEWSHLEEHCFEDMELDTLSRKFDKAGDKARDRRRPILDRIFNLGGSLPGTIDDPASALQSLLLRLEALHALCGKAYDAADAGFQGGGEDYVTKDLLRSNQSDIEAAIFKLTAKLAYFRAIGPQLARTEWE